MAMAWDERENAKMCRRDATQTQTNQPIYQSCFCSCFIFAISLAIGLRMLFNVAYAQCLQIHENIEGGKTFICQPASQPAGAAAAENISCASSSTTYFS